MFYFVFAEQNPTYARTIPDPSSGRTARRRRRVQKNLQAIYYLSRGKDLLECVDAVKFAMEMCKYNFVPKLERLQAIYYLSRSKDVFVVALHAFSICLRCFVLIT
jgi:hypothetical protein